MCLRGPVTPYSMIGIAMLSRDGVWHCWHPIFATFVSDDPGRIFLILSPERMANTYRDVRARQLMLDMHESKSSFTWVILNMLTPELHTSMQRPRC